MNLHTITKEIVSNYGIGITSDFRFINILNDLNYFKEYPHHRYILTAMIQLGMLKLIWLNCGNNDLKELYSIGRTLIEKIMFKEQIVTELLSALSGSSIPIGDIETLWHPSLVDDKDGLKRYVLNILRYSFCDGTEVKTTYCQIRNINDFTVGFTFAKFESIDIKKLQDNGDFITNDCVGVDVWLRNGEYLTVLEDESYNNRINFEWQHPDWASGEWVGDKFIYTDTEPSLYVRIHIPIYDIYTIVVSYPH